MLVACRGVRLSSASHQFLILLLSWPLSSLQSGLNPLSLASSLPSTIDLLFLTYELATPKSVPKLLSHTSVYPPPTKVLLRRPSPAWTHLCPKTLFLVVPPTPKNGSVADSDLSHPAFTTSMSHARLLALSYLTLCILPLRSPLLLTFPLGSQQF